jgi:DNA-binding FadR family transcriptional regulator
LDPERPPEQGRSLRIHQALAQQIGMAILSGGHKPGDNLGGEIEQSLALGVSRTAYREAMRILTAKGLLQSRPKAGTSVTPRHRWNLLDPDILAWMFMGEPDPHFIRDLFELRGIIEPAAAAIAAERRTGSQLAEMKAALDEMRQWGLAVEQGQAADRRFHRAILVATGNEALISLAGSVGAAVQWTTHFKQRAHKVPRDPVPEHAALFDAVAAQDVATARQAMVHLLELALADMTLP